jgi:hypothetical protein
MKSAETRTQLILLSMFSMRAGESAWTVMHYHEARTSFPAFPAITALPALIMSPPRIELGFKV